LKDPRAGSIAPDAFLETVHNLDGTPLVQNLVDQFNCLQTTGKFCKGFNNSSLLPTAFPF